VLLVGGGSRSLAVRQVLADLCDLPVEVVEAVEAASTGACVQAATTAGGGTAAEVAERWGLGLGTPVEPSPTHDSADVRGAYAALRAEMHP
jgi:xylulokinase